MPFVTSMNMLVPNLSQYIHISMNAEKYEGYYNISYFEGRREELQEIYEQTIYFDMTDYALMSDAAAYALSGMPLNEEDRIDEYNLPLGVITADCLPVMIAGEKCISSLHCGWRSLNGGIIDNAFKLFQKHNDKVIYAYIGAGICNKCYEVKDDLINQLVEKYKPAECLTKKDDEHYLLDMKKLATNALMFNGLHIDNIEVSSHSSCCNKELYSYRLENGKTGRMVTTIVKNK